MRNSLLLARAAAAALALAACGGGGGGPSGPPSQNPPPNPSNPNPNPTAPAATASVAMRTDTDVYGDQSNSFVPASVTIARNGRVTWSNATGVAHNVTFDGSTGAPANVANHASGDNARTFAVAGTFGYSCTNHPGMAGTVVVAP